MYFVPESKSDSLFKCEVCTERKEAILVDQVARENLSLRRSDAVEENYIGVCLRARDHRIRRGQPLYGK